MSAAIVMRPQFGILEIVQAAAGAVTERKGPASVPARLQLVRACAEEVLRQTPVATQLTHGTAAADRAGYPFYRKYTEGMLRRYGTLSMESGRVPSMLGREMFRGKVTSYKVRSFDDVVIFVHDVEQCLKGMSLVQQHLIERIALQGYTQGETAGLIGVSLRTVIRRYNLALDELTRIFLTRRMLEPLSGLAAQ